jgi:hypothetical protein
MRLFFETFSIRPILEGNQGKTGEASDSMECICNTNITAIEEWKFTESEHHGQRGTEIHKGELESMCTPHWCSGIVVVFVFLQFMDERQGET